jgi:hypothetical protein
MRLVKQETDFWPFLCGIDLTLAKPFIANDLCTCELIKICTTTSALRHHLIYVHQRLLYLAIIYSFVIFQFFILFKSTNSSFSSIFPKFREQNYVLLPYPNSLHNIFPLVFHYTIKILFLYLLTFTFFYKISTQSLMKGKMMREKRDILC